MKKSSTEEFINRSKQIFGDKYDYSRVDYINNTTSVIIGYNGIFYGCFSWYKNKSISRI